MSNTDNDDVIKTEEQEEQMIQDYTLEKMGMDILESFEKEEREEQERKRKKESLRKELMEKKSGNSWESQENNPRKKEDTDDDSLFQYENEGPEAFPDGSPFRPWTIPLEDIRTIFANLRKIVLGQEEAIAEIEKMFVINTVRSKFNKGCVFSMFLVGGSGVGKTMIFEEISKQINMINESRGKSLRTTFHKIPMNNYYAIEVPSMIGGVSPGWTGSDKGTSLFSTIAAENEKNDNLYRSGFILLDEYEKLQRSDHHDDRTAMNSLSEVLSHAIFSVKSGDYEKIDLRNCVIIFSSNHFSNEIIDKVRTIGFSNDDNYASVDENEPLVGPEINKKEIERKLRKYYSISAINRIDKIVVFNPLPEEVLKDFIRQEYRKMCMRIRKTYLEIEHLPKVDHYMNEILSGYDKTGGYRAVSRHINRETAASIIMKYVYCTAKNQTKENEKVTRGNTTGKSMETIG